MSRLPWVLVPIRYCLLSPTTAAWDTDNRCSGGRTGDGACTVESNEGGDLSRLGNLLWFIIGWGIFYLIGQLIPADAPSSAAKNRRENS